MYQSKKSDFLSILIFLIPFICAGQYFREIAKIVASDRSAGAQFSSSVDIQGNYAIVGAHREQKDSNGNNPLSQSGAVYTYKLTNGNWTQTQKLTPSDRTWNDLFGASVALDGNHIVVGARFDSDSINGGPSVSSAGSAYIFERNANGVWTQVQKLVAPDRSPLAYFGTCVDMLNNEIVIGAPLADLNGGPLANPGAGAVYVFEKNNSGTWVFTQKIYAPDPDNGDSFGSSVSLSANDLVVGATGESRDAAGNNAVSDAGAAYIFQKQGGQWVKTQKLVGTQRNPIDHFGWAVSVSGSDLVVTAYKDNLDALGQNYIYHAGSAYFYSKSGLSWILAKKVVASDRSSGDVFGSSAALAGKYAILGSNSATDSLGNNAVTQAGAAYIFKKQNSGWQQLQKIVSADRQASDDFGYPCAISDSTIILSAIFENEDENGLNTMQLAGSAYIFNPCKVAYNTLIDTSCVSYVSPSGKYTWTSNGTYQDTLKTREGCDSILTIHLVIQSASIPLQINTVNIQDPLCYNGKNGELEINVSGGATPYDIQWNTGDSALLLSNLDSGFYKVVVTDKYGCSDSATYRLHEPDSIAISLINLSNVTCFNRHNGSLDVSVSGGVPPLSISWSNGDTTKIINKLPGGIYQITVTDSMGCSRTKSFTIEEPDSLALLGDIENISCNGNKDGAITVIANGGTPPYHFSWDNGSQGSSIENLPQGIYHVSVTDSNGCTNQAEFQIIEPESLKVSLTEQKTPSCGKANGEITLIVMGGTKPYTIEWNGNRTGTNLKNIEEGNYTATVTDSNGCSIIYEMHLDGSSEDRLYFANTFTPNGDNLNDVYKLVGASECFTNAHFVIFDRWGKMIFKTNKPFVDFWDGKVQGKTNNPKVDVYTFHFTSEEYSAYGYIQVIR